ncbi:hypothetical protein AALA78_03240 [Lachnospiraceae bacterium 42-17]
MPFGIEDIQKEDKKSINYDWLTELNIMAEVFNDKNTTPYLKRKL